MTKEKKELKNKKIWQWIIINLFLVLFGASIIANISYIPKYLALKNRNDNTLKVNISAYDDTSDSPIKLFLFHYQTTMLTLGDLMEQYQDTYTLESSGALGRALKAVSYYSEEEKKIKKLAGSWTPGQPYWFIYYNHKPAPTGIDNLYLEMNTVVELHYTREHK